MGNVGEMLKSIPDGSMNMCVTSPPYYGLRDYGHKKQIGLEKTPELYIEKLVEVFREVRRTLRDDGTLWINIGDSYWGGKGYSGSSAGIYQYERRKLTGWRLVPVQIMTGFLLNFKGLGIYRQACTAKLKLGLANTYGTFVRLIKLKVR